MAKFKWEVSVNGEHHNKISFLINGDLGSVLHKIAVLEYKFEPVKVTLELREKSE